MISPDWKDQTKINLLKYRENKARLGSTDWKLISWKMTEIRSLFHLEIRTRWSKIGKLNILKELDNLRNTRMLFHWNWPFTRGKSNSTSTLWIESKLLLKNYNFRRTKHKISTNFSKTIWENSAMKLISSENSNKIAIAKMSWWKTTDQNYKKWRPKLNRAKMNSTM